MGAIGLVQRRRRASKHGTDASPRRFRVSVSFATRYLTFGRCSVVSIDCKSSMLALSSQIVKLRLSLEGGDAGGGCS